MNPVETNITTWLDRHIAQPPDTDQCVQWPYAITHNGHPVYNGQSVTRIIIGLQPGDGLVARHSCHNPTCINIRHLSPGTPADNSRDMVEAGRSLAGQRNPMHGMISIKGRRPVPKDNS